MFLFFIMDSTIMHVTDFDLLRNKHYYDIKTLESNVSQLDKKILLATQTLTADFCVKYIWDPDIESGSEDSYIFDVPYMLYFQKHLSESDFESILDGNDETS